MSRKKVVPKSKDESIVLSFTEMTLLARENNRLINVQKRIRERDSRNTG